MTRKMNDKSDTQRNHRSAPSTVKPDARVPQLSDDIKRLKAEIAPVFANDYEELASFLSTFPGVASSCVSWHARLRWWWDNNPAFSEDLVRGWTLRAEGKIVGFLGSIPLRFMADGRETIAFAGTTWRVLPEYRGLSFALKQRQMKDRKGSMQFATTPTPNNAALLKLLRNHDLGQWQGGPHHSFVVTDFRRVLRRKFGDGQICRLAALASLPFAALLQSFLLRNLRRPKSLHAHEIAKAGQAFDDLWNRTRRVYRNTNVRGSRELNWYCSSTLGGEKMLWGCYAGDLLIGFMILLADDQPGMKLLGCVDLWLDPAWDQIEIVRALVSKTVECARARHLDLVVFPHFNHKIANCYRSLGLLRRPAWHRREFVTGPTEILDAMTPENTYFVGAQGDQGL